MIFESCILVATLAFANPADPSGTTMYPSGRHDNDNFVFSAPPISAYPILTIGSPIKLKNGTILEIGNYCVKPSINEKTILLIQGDKIFCVCQIVENTIVNEFAAKPIAKIIQNDKELFLTYQIENIFKKAIIPISKENLLIQSAHRCNSNL